METISVSDLVSAYSKLSQEAIEEYATKNNMSSIPAEDLKLLTEHVGTYCMDKIAEQLIQVKERNNEAEIKPDILEENKDLEQEKCKEPAPIHQSSTSEISVDFFMKLMTDHHKQQQEHQSTVLKTFSDQMKHQHSQIKEQQNRFQEQVLQQQDFQTRLMADFMKHSEMQTALLCQTLSNCKLEQPHHDGHINNDIKDTPFHGSCSPEMINNFNEGDNSFSARASAKKMESFSHFQVSKREKQQLFDCNKLGQKFCQWFFPLLNSQNPTHGQERLPWDSQIFYSDAVFSFTYDNTFERYTGDECISSKLLEMMQKDKLTFTPTIDSKRFKCVNSRHGLVVVAVTGIISRIDSCSMVFNQIFGLIKCPSTGNYKIKIMTLKVDNMNTLTSQHEFHVPPLQYTTEQLENFQN